MRAEFAGCPLAPVRCGLSASPDRLAGALDRWAGALCAAPVPREACLSVACAAVFLATVVFAGGALLRSRKWAAGCRNGLRGGLLDAALLNEG